jgi:hypothetical protein
VRVMKIKLLFCLSCLLLGSTFTYAGPILIIGTPTNSAKGGTKPSPILPGSTLLNFDGLTPFATFPSFSSQGITISSSDGFMVLPFSAQSAPNELFDNSLDGSADIDILVNHGVRGIGVGISDSDSPVTILLQPLNFLGEDLGPAFFVTIPESDPDTAGNAYFVVQDSTEDIFGLNITASATGQSGLAIDDVQITPEPSTATLGIAGFLLLILARKRLTTLSGLDKGLRH